MHRLIHKKAEWNWTHVQEDAFEKIKDAVSKVPVLKYFSESDPTKGKEMHLQAETFASRAPTLAERKYSQIRKELQAQVFRMEHNHHHVYVRKVILYTDHKLLVSILWKPLASVFKRLQRLLLRLQQYDCEIRFKPDKEMLLADTLSGAYSEDYERSATESEVECIHATHFLPVPDHQLKKL